MTKEAKTIRVTKGLLLKLVNEQLKAVEIQYIGTEVTRSRYRDHEYEAGAWHWRVRLEPLNKEPLPFPLYIYCYLPFSEFQRWLNNGYKLTLKMKGRSMFIGDIEIDLTR